MPIASYEKEWTGIKKNFEQATGKKKPSESLLGVFKKGSGIAKATSEFDTAMETEDPKAVAKALGALDKAVTAYQTTLSKAVGDEKDKGVQAETKVMINELTNLLDQAENDSKHVGKIERCKTARDVVSLLDSKAGERVRDYAKKTLNTDTVLFLEAMAKKDYSAKTFKTFIAEGSKYEVNIDHNLRSKFDEKDLRAAPWDEATQECLNLFNANVVQPLSKGK